MIATAVESTRHCEDISKASAVLIYDAVLIYFPNNVFDGNKHSRGRITSLSPCFTLSVCVVQFQKQGKDMDKVKQRLAEIANYVDKVTIKSTGDLV